MARLRKTKSEEVEVLEVENTGEEVEVENTGEEVEVVTGELEEATSKEEKAETIDVIDKAVENAKEVATTETKVVKEPNVRINPKQDIRTYIGDQWYNLKAGKVVSVPKTVKDKLQKAGLLNAI